MGVAGVDQREYGGQESSATVAVVVFGIKTVDYGSLVFGPYLLLRPVFLVWSWFGPVGRLSAGYL